jgi:hypothetical protein
MSDDTAPTRISVTEPDAPPPTLEDGSPDDDAQNNLIVRDEHGDPLPDPKAVVMRERDSYERVVEGLAIAADRAKHCGRGEPRRFAMWNALADKLDKVRKVAVEMAGLSDKPVLQSGEVRGEAIDWLTAKRQFSDGLKQAAGGARQIAIVHRGDAMWLKIARQIDQLADSTKRSPILQPRLGPGGLLLPPGQFSRAVH